MRAILVLLLAGALGAQDFQQLATNRDGSVLYFSASARMRGSSQYFHRKIFSWDAVNGVRLYAQLASDLPVPPCCIIMGGVYYHLAAPSVSSDGTTVAYSGSIDCNDDICAFFENYQTTIDSAGIPPVTAPGAGTLSPNGRYVYLVSSLLSDYGGPHTITVLDLQTGQTTPYTVAAPWPGLGGKHRVANDGSVVIATRGGLALVEGAVTLDIPGSAMAQGGVTQTMINDAATEVVFVRSVSAQSALSVYSVTNGATIDLVTEGLDSNGAFADFGAAISDDGSEIVLLYGAGRQVYAVASSGQGLRQLTNLPEAVSEVVLSGDGTTAFAVTAGNRIVRIGVASGAVDEIVPATPYVSAYDPEISRGGILQVNGSALAVQTLSADAPYPTTLGGVEAIANGEAAPITQVSPASISLAVPWDMPDAVFQIEIDTASSTSPFVPGVEVETVAPQPYYSSDPNGPFLFLAAHQDFSALVSAQNPAMPGEIVHLYAHDLGPVSPAPPAGVPAPLQPIATLAVPISCTFQDSADYSSNLNVLFAGLAPELLNVFQIDVRLPASFTGNLGGIGCQIYGGSGCDNGAPNCEFGGYLNLSVPPG